MNGRKEGQSVEIVERQISRYKSIATIIRLGGFNFPLWAALLLGQIAWKTFHSYVQSGIGVWYFAGGWCDPAGAKPHRVKQKLNRRKWSLLLMTKKLWLTNFSLESRWWQGSDPRAATCRSKLQSKRAKLNQEINKELRLRAGAENLFRYKTLNI